MGIPSEAETVATHADDVNRANRIKFKIVGIGGAGIQALKGIRETLKAYLGDPYFDIDFWALDSDLTARATIPGTNFLQLGATVAKGKSTRGSVALGQQAAQESREALLCALSGAFYVLIVAGPTGGISAGAAPIVADLARTITPDYYHHYQKGPLVAAYVSSPRDSSPAETVLALRGKVDSLTLIFMNEATAKTESPADSRLIGLGIELITITAITPGLIGVDSEDIRQCLQKNPGFSRLAYGHASGEALAIDAAKKAISSPALEKNLSQAGSVVFLVKGGNDMTRYNVNEAAEVIYNACNQEAEIVFGATVHPELQGQMEVLIQASGLPSICQINDAMTYEMSWS